MAEHGGKRPGAGRPKGSKNRRQRVWGAQVEQICEIHRHHPTEFLVMVAKGEVEELSEPEHILKANLELHKSIHGKPRVAIDNSGITMEGQFQLVFEESNDPFTLPGAADAARPGDQGY